MGKLACRNLIKGCDDIKSAPVWSGENFLPDLFPGECATTNTGELMAFFKPLAEYISPALEGNSRRTRKAVSIDGFVSQGSVHHYCISDNVYRGDVPEEFDCLVTPTQRLTQREIDACWERYDNVAREFVQRGLDNQFLDLEVFVVSNGDGPDSNASGTVEIKTIEVNCRTFANQLPIFSNLYGNSNPIGVSEEGTRSENSEDTITRNTDMFSVAVDMLLGKKPSSAALSLASRIVIDKDKCEESCPCDPSTDSPSVAPRGIGVCAYKPPIIHLGSPVVISQDRDTVYYHGDFGSEEHFPPAHVYVINRQGSEEEARKRCDEFYAELVAASSTVDKVHKEVVL